MRRAASWAALVLLAWLLPALAQPPAASLRPEARTGPAAAVAEPGLRPMPRPASEQARLMQASATRPVTGPAVSARPVPRSAEATQAFLFKKRRARREAERGSVCGDIALQGEAIGRVPGQIRGCGIDSAVRLRSVSGVVLSTPATMDCATALALKQWVDTGLKPAFRRRGPVVEMRVAASYACRTRNNQRGGKISEHGKGRAIDLSAFTMKDGEVITVLRGWGQGTTARPLRRAWAAACGPFGTVLGPNSDRFHRDHFHFDTARHRGGAYCR